MSVEVNLRDLYVASGHLSDMGDVYSDVVGELAKTDDVTVTFNGGGAGASWLNLLNTYWNLCADSQDNLNETSQALVYYINEVCEKDGDNAEELLKDVQGYNKELFNDLAGSNPDGDNEYIEKDERTDAGYSEEYFDELDTNNDGKISREEQEKDTVNTPIDEPDLGNKDEVIEEKDKDAAARPEGAK